MNVIMKFIRLDKNNLNSFCYIVTQPNRLKTKDSIGRVLMSQ